MKEYFKRIISDVPKYRLIFWWVRRALLIYAFIAGFFKKPFDITDPLQVGANFLCTFIWEIFQMLSEKNSLRHLPSIVQSFLIVGIFAASFGGKFLNLYYDLKWWDIVLHFIGGGACVFFGYEIASAMQMRDHALGKNPSAPLSLVLLCAMGFSFLASTGWELFEFTFDSISCISNKAAFEAGTMTKLEALAKSGDAQHWNAAAAAGTAKGSFQLIKGIWDERWPIMDTMTDIVLNTVGALVSIIFIAVYPYRHKGRFKMKFIKDEK